MGLGHAAGCRHDGWLPPRRVCRGEVSNGGVNRQRAGMGLGYANGCHHGGWLPPAVTNQWPPFKRQWRSSSSC